MAVNFEKTVLKLQKLLITKDLGEFLSNEATKYISILNSENTSYEDKHFTNILAEDFISKVRDFPEIISSSNKTR